MCLNCGCMQAHDDMGKPGVNITYEDVKRAADANGTTVEQALETIARTAEKDRGDHPGGVRRLAVNRAVALPERTAGRPWSTDRISATIAVATCSAPSAPMSSPAGAWSAARSSGVGGRRHLVEKPLSTVARAEDAEVRDPAAEEAAHERRVTQVVVAHDDGGGPLAGARGHRRCFPARRREAAPPETGPDAATCDADPRRRRASPGAAQLRRGERHPGRRRRRPGGVAAGSGRGRPRR